jgi:hypothetical protein
VRHGVTAVIRSDSFGGGMNPMDKSFVWEGERRAILEMNLNFTTGHLEGF